MFDRELIAAPAFAVVSCVRQQLPVFFPAMVADEVRCDSEQPRHRVPELGIEAVLLGKPDCEHFGCEVLRRRPPIRRARCA
jgi:hypothetical protein